MRTIGIYHCAYCKVRGDQLVREGQVLVCRDKLKCAQRCSANRNKANTFSVKDFLKNNGLWPTR